ncbi:DUF6691 family protein [Aquisalimonas asiatica]|uniref:Sulphur transport domain-containing protein n=1 Tax=Aquisalimonas asiatica TaxID=406100 RepID=A0A1H8PTW2_9GAMM|nr:DUF6691 family protein [Aquisalimonas asiatica]SEO45462.1 hypothetical protein SAMN04488052_101161 [Aquisalimonas asiatica]
MRTLLSAFAVGLIFGVGLLVSGMANPEKVLGFLDLAGAWDPSLALVMVGAIGTAFIAFRVAAGRRESVFGEPMRLPASNAIDSRLLLGALGFGVGWGMAGFCPGPALVALGAGEAKALAFVASMVAGMGVFELIERTRRQ